MKVKTKTPKPLVKKETDINPNTPPGNQSGNGNPKTRRIIPAVVLALVAAAVVLYLVIRVITTGKNIAGQCKGYNLVVITLDTLRADRVGAYGYKPAKTPNLDLLAHQGILFENCYAPAPITLASHCSIFTGKYPLGHRVRTNGTYFLPEKTVTLAEKMKELGFRTYAVIASYVLQSKFGLKQGFDIYDDSLDIKELITDFDSEIKADRVYAKFNRWLETQYRQPTQATQGNSAPPFLAWIHFYDPHLPYEPPEAYQKEMGTGLEQRYNGEVAYMDFYVGKVIETLKNHGLLEQTIIILVGDHGEGFGEHQEYGHSIFCYQEMLKVPLIFYNPRLLSKGLRIKPRVNLTDIMPTLLEMYGLEKPAGLQGESFGVLLAGGKAKIGKERTFYFESMQGKEENGWAALTGIIHDQYKYISLPEPELYDMNADPQEKDNLVWKKNPLAKNLDQRLMKLVKTYSGGPGKTGDESRRALTAADKQHLQTLGYISAFDNTGKTPTALDPKKGIIEDFQLEKIKTAIEEGKLDQAETQLKEIAGKNPQTLSPQYFGLLNSLYKKRNDLPGAIRTWQQAIEAYPNNENFKINLAFEYFNLNRLEESENLANRILETDPQFTKAYILIGRIRERRNQIPEALTSLEKALSTEPQNFSLKLNYAKLLGREKNYTKAAEVCRELLADETALQDPGLKTRLGIVLAEIDNDDQAMTLLTQVQEDGKATAETWNYLGILYSRKRQYRESVNAYLKSVEMDSRQAKTYNNLGSLYLTLFLLKKETPMRDQAMKAFNKALELEPGLVSALNGRASAYKFGGKTREAINDWKKVIAMQPDFIDAYFNLGITYLELKSRPEALKYLTLLKEKFYRQLPGREQQRLDRLVREAGG